MQHLYDRMKTIIIFMQLLKYGLNYSIERPASSYTVNLVAETEQAIRLIDAKLQNTYCFMAKGKEKKKKKKTL
jgi:hypothetical protein